MRSAAFTLIELLIVIAIIGILASAVVISLGSATEAAKDAKNKLAIAQVRPLALLDQQVKGNYSSVCDDVQIKRVLESLGAAADVFCADDTNAWVIAFKSEADDTKYFCADNDEGPSETGRTKASGTNVDTVMDGKTACP